MKVYPYDYPKACIIVSDNNTIMSLLDSPETQKVMKKMGKMNRIVVPEMEQ